MIWDRFDDAHDDLRAEIRAARQAVAELARRLTAAGIACPPFVEPPLRAEPDADASYRNAVDERDALESYRSELERLLAGRTPDSGG